MKTIERATDKKIKIIHITKGRVRLRVPQLSEDADYAHRLEKFVLDIDEVDSVRINCAAASVVLTYHVNGKSDAEMPLYLINLIKKVDSIATDNSQMSRSPSKTIETKTDRVEKLTESKKTEAIEDSRYLRVSKESYEDLKRKCEEQNKQIADLQKLIELQKSIDEEQTKLINNLQKQLAELQSEANIGIWWLNKWNRHFFN